MSFAWKTTDEDVLNVLKPHRIKCDDIRAKTIGLDHDRIEDAALGDDMEEQTNNAYCEIEEQLIKLGVIPIDAKRHWINY